MQFLRINTLQSWRNVLAAPAHKPVLPEPATHPIPIVFVDSRIQGSIDLEDSAWPDMVGIELARNQDGLLQITAILDKLHSVSSIHLLVQGDPGCCLIGNTCITLATLLHYRPYLALWKRCRPSGLASIPVLFYRERTTSALEEQALFAQFHQLTQLPVGVLSWDETTFAATQDWRLSYWSEPQREGLPQLLPAQMMKHRV